MTASQFPSNLPVEPPRESTAVAYGQNYLPTWATQSPLEEPGISWARYFSALKRYKWLILFVALGGYRNRLRRHAVHDARVPDAGHDLDLRERVAAGDAIAGPDPG